jgi:hypothetical protein
MMVWKHTIASPPTHISKRLLNSRFLSLLLVFAFAYATQGTVDYTHRYNKIRILPPLEAPFFTRRNTTYQ